MIQTSMKELIGYSMALEKLFVSLSLFVYAMVLFLLQP